MRLPKCLRMGVLVVLAGGVTAVAQTVADDNVAGSLHFAGAAHLANDTNFAKAKIVLGLQPSADFKNLVLNRFAGWLAGALQLHSNVDSPALLRPLLDDLLLAESTFDLGGRAPGPLNFILALRLDDARAEVWQANLRQALGGPGGSFTAGEFTGERWDQAGDRPFWMVRGRGWLLLGSGRDLQARQTQYLQQLSAMGRPGPALGPGWLESSPASGQNWLEADFDWPRLAHWLPQIPFSLKPARTQIAMTTKAGTLRMRAMVTYPEALAWKFDPWRIPTNIIRNPLVSFTAGQDIAALMTANEPLSKLTDNPLQGQFYLWAMGIQGMPFQSFAAWPVANPTNTLERIAAQSLTAFNPELTKRNSGDLVWDAKAKSLYWEKLATFLNPSLQVAAETNGPYLVASLFPLIKTDYPFPSDLLSQFAGRTNLVYYDWEQTSFRLQHWRVLSPMLPVFPRVTPPASAPSTNRVAQSKAEVPPGVVEDNWLAGMTNLDNTVTEITRTGPAELTIVRKSPFALTSLELVMLSHWLAGVNSPAINVGLLPPRAKVTGPGINSDNK